MQIEEMGMMLFSKQTYQKATLLFWRGPFVFRCQWLLNLLPYITMASDCPQSQRRHSHQGPQAEPRLTWCFQLAAYSSVFLAARKNRQTSLLPQPHLVLLLPAWPLFQGRKDIRMILRERQKKVLVAASMKLRLKLARSKSTTDTSNTSLKDLRACGSMVPH